MEPDKYRRDIADLSAKFVHGLAALDPRETQRAQKMAAMLAATSLAVMTDDPSRQDDLDFLMGPIVVHGDVERVPPWLMERIRPERIEIACGLRPGMIVGPVEICAVLSNMSLEQPLHHNTLGGYGHLAYVYMWASYHALSERAALDVKEGESRFEAIRRWRHEGAANELTIPADADILAADGKYHECYRLVCEEIRRMVLAHARGQTKVEKRRQRDLNLLQNTLDRVSKAAEEVMKTKSITIPPEVTAVLSTATCQGNVVQLPAQLDRKLYEATDRVLRALGGKWSKRAGGHVFPGEVDAAAALADALGTGSVIDRQKTLQLFETPPDLAARLASELPAGATVLEPSAGTGRLVGAALAAGAQRVQAVELDAANCKAIIERYTPGAEVRQANFLTLTPPDLPPADAVLMNPPFKAGLDIQHVQHALQMLKPGGSLTAIMSPHAFHAQNRAARDFRALVAELGGTVETLPAGTFKLEGTNVESRIIRLRKP